MADRRTVEQHGAWKPPGITQAPGGLLALVVLLVAPVGGTGAAPPGDAQYRVTAAASVERGENTAALNDQLVVTVSDLKGWLKSKNYKVGDRQRILLFIRNREIPGAHPIRVHFVEGKDALVFELRRTPESREAWTAILARPVSWTQEVPITVGLDDGPPLPTDVRSFELIVIRWDLILLLVALVFALSLGLFVWMARKSNIIRDDGPEPEAGVKPYSLARAQMAFWLFLVLASYLLIWVITRDRDTIPESVLALMGISAGTALGAIVIDASKRSAAQSDLAAAERDLTLLQARQPAASAAELNVLTTRIAQLKAHQDAAKSRGFFRDLVSETDGVSLHRFQICVWTVVLGIIFIVSVFTDLAMPTFGTTLLALMGISGATYVGFKWPDANTPGA